MGNIVQSVYNVIIGNVENMSSNTTNFNKNQITNLIMAQSIQEEKSVKNKSINWLSVANCFTGREDILKKIKEEFTDKKCVVLHGMPGIGKTETARQFGTRFCDSFHGNLIWIFSETPDNIKQSFDKLAKSLKIDITDASQIFNQFKTTKALIVFDNAECMTTIRDYLPSNQLHPTVYVLITSRHSNWGLSTYISKIPLNSLNMADALSIFKQKLGHKFEENELEEWKELVQKLDGIPLCLQIVSSLIQQEVNRIRLIEFNLKDFINELEVKLISSTTSEFEQDYYQKSVHTAINSVLSRLEEVKAISSLDLLCFVAYLDADFIFIDDLLLIPSIEKSKHQLEEALNKLVDYSLIQIEKEPYLSMKIKVHRTVQLVLRDFDLKQRNGDMLKTLLRLTSNSDGMYWHRSSMFKYETKKEFLEKTKEFYNENHENESLIKKYAENLVEFNCHKALQIILPEFLNGRSDKFIQLLFFAIDMGKDFRTIQVFLIAVAQNQEDVREIEALTEWQSTKFIDILLECSIFKNRENVSEYMILKNSGMGRFLHSLVKWSNKENVRETFECINHLIYKWGADLFYKDDYLNNILHAACFNREISLKIIDYLFQLKNGKLKRIVDCQNDGQQTPLHFLLDWNTRNPNLFEIFCYFIINCNADITLKNNQKENVLFNICANGSFEILEFILKERDCSQIINDQNEWGNVAFYRLICNDSIEEAQKIKLFNLFFENGMDINWKIEKNKTLFDFAEERGLNTLTKVIKNHLKELERNASKKRKR